MAASPSASSLHPSELSDVDSPLPERWVYSFGGGHADGNRHMRDLLGGKGANLAEMAALGLPVPPGFTISTLGCKYVSTHHGNLPATLLPQIDEAMAKMEKVMGKKFGDSTAAPLLVSVRSGAAVSMPGMMDTVLNLGLNDATAAAMVKASGNKRWVMDSYRRFVAMHAEVVRGVKHELFEAEITRLKAGIGAESDLELTADHLMSLVGTFKDIYKREIGEPFPEAPRDQLMQAIAAVFGSWNTPRAVTYRKINKVFGLLGTAVNVQAMVYGNMGATSGTGVLFTRNPSTGEDVLYGEYLENAQGEDVVAGIRTPLPIARLEELNKPVYDELYAHVKRLERHFKCIQDCEFTVEDGRLFTLQTRDGKRTGAAAVKIAVDMVEEGLVSQADAIAKLVTPAHVDQLLHPRFKDEAGFRKRGAVLTKGLGASPGAAVGRIVFDSEEAAEADGPVILVRIETSAEDVKGMHSAQGILTQTGGMTSHAAVVARGWGKPCVCGAKDIAVDYAAQTLTAGGRTVAKGDWLSLQGTTGEVILGQEETMPPELGADLVKFVSWVHRVDSRLAVRANADTPADVAQARSLGAVGIGLVRTEHMFFGEDRIWAVREMILAETEAARRTALDKLFEHQRADFYGIFKAMGGGPVTIRMLDPPLHEFLPKGEAQQAEMARRLGVPEKDVHRRVESLAESNPMLGHRGCRLGITNPEITEMQTRAIMDAACAITAESAAAGGAGAATSTGASGASGDAGGEESKAAVVEIMVPLVATASELANQRAVIARVCAETIKAKGVSVAYKIGTMIETPRAALTAEAVGEHADFFSFGTNDLTQMTFGFSRDDAAKFLPRYIDAGVLRDDPFQSIDRDGVGALVKRAVDAGRALHGPAFKCGVCGEHGGDERSVAFFYDIGLSYVSCSPFRVPLAMLASAQAALKERAAAAARSAVKDVDVHGHSGHH